MHHKTAGDSGAFGDDGRHAPALYCLQVNVERVNERPGYETAGRKYTNAKRVIGMCFVDANENPKQDPRKLHHKTAGDSGAFG